MLLNSPKTTSSSAYGIFHSNNPPRTFDCPHIHLRPSYNTSLCAHPLTSRAHSCQYHLITLVLPRQYNSHGVEVYAVSSSTFPPTRQINYEGYTPHRGSGTKLKILGPKLKKWALTLTHFGPLLGVLFCTPFFEFGPRG